MSYELRAIPMHDALRPSGRTRERWGRTIRTITCELTALTGPAQPAGHGRPTATPEALVQLPSFQAHMLNGSIVARPEPARVRPLPVPRPAAATPAAAAAPRPAARGRGLVGPLVLFGLTAALLGWAIALASG